MALLEVDNINVRYGAVTALKGVSLRVEEGEVVTLIGANGAGKTTTLRAISGLANVAEGAVKFQGEAIHNRPPHETVARGLVQVPEGRGIFGNLTVAENLVLGAFSRSDVGDLLQDYERVYTLFPRVKERLQQNAGTLSGGEQQMVAIARALLARPKLLLLDEPSLGLAPQVVQTIFQIIRQIHEAGTTILLVEQNARLALQVADRAYVLETGAIQMEGPAKELAASDAVRQAYLGAH